MLEGSGQNAIGLDLLMPAFNVLVGDCYLFRPLDAPAAAGDAQAALFHRDIPLSLDDLGVHKHAQALLVIYVDHDQAAHQADLRRGKANAIGSVHGFTHVTRDHLQSQIKFGHGVAHRAQQRVPDMQYGFP